jgi:alpha-tubulin suppressor-like RCC1 family protein
MSTSNVASIDARFYTTMFVDSAGRLFGAGKNAEGMLGDGSTLDRSSFVQALGISHATQVACGYRHAAVRTAEGKVYTSGQNAGTYRLGVGDTVYRSSFVLAVGISNAMAVSCGFSSSIALRSDGAVYVGGGSVSAGESANGTGVANATFAQAIGISNAIAIASGFKSHYALRSDGIPFAVGYNSAGQLGDGSTTDRSTFVAVTGVSQVIAISAGGAFFNVYALRSDGAVFAAGSNFYGQIGDGGTISRSTFVQAVGLSQIVAIAPGLALRADGRLFAVGWNSSGQLGDGTTTNRSSFIAVL